MAGRFYLRRFDHTLRASLFYNVSIKLNKTLNPDNIYLISVPQQILSFLRTLSPDRVFPKNFFHTSKTFNYYHRYEPSKVTFSEIECFVITATSPI